MRKKALREWRDELGDWELEDEDDREAARRRRDSYYDRHKDDAYPEKEYWYDAANGWKNPPQWK